MLFTVQAAAFTALALSATCSAASSAFSPKAGYRRADTNTTTSTLTDPADTKLTGALANWEYVGCFNDTSSHIIATASITSSNMTQAYCISYCNSGGYAWAGVEYGNQCGCASNTTVSSTASSVSPSNANSVNTCNMACANAATERCGGFFLFNLWKNTKLIADTTTTSSSSAISFSSASANSASASPSTSAAAVAGGNTQAAAKSSSKAGPIAGGVIGGVVALALILFGLFCWRRTQRYQRRGSGAVPGGGSGGGGTWNRADSANGDYAIPGSGSTAAFGGKEVPVADEKLGALENGVGNGQEPIGLMPLIVGNGSSNTHDRTSSYTPSTNDSPESSPPTRDSPLNSTTHLNPSGHPSPPSAYNYNTSPLDDAGEGAYLGYLSTSPPPPKVPSSIGSASSSLNPGSAPMVVNRSNSLSKPTRKPVPQLTLDDVDIPAVSPMPTISQLPTTSGETSPTLAAGVRRTPSYTKRSSSVDDGTGGRGPSPTFGMGGKKMHTLEVDRLD